MRATDDDARLCDPCARCGHERVYHIRALKQFGNLSPCAIPACECFVFRRAKLARGERLVARKAQERIPLRAAVRKMAGEYVVVPPRASESAPTCSLLENDPPWMWSWAEARPPSEWKLTDNRRFNSGPRGPRRKGP